jgi:hypothetical protein
MDLTPGTALFVGGFVAAMFAAAAGLTYVAGGGTRAVTGFAFALAGLGGAFLLLATGVAALLYAADVSTGD